MTDYQLRSGLNCDFVDLDNFPAGMANMLRVGANEDFWLEGSCDGRCLLLLKVGLVYRLGLGDVANDSLAVVTSVKFTLPDDALVQGTGDPEGNGVRSRETG